MIPPPQETASLPEAAGAPDKLAFLEHMYQSQPCGLIQFSADPEPVVLGCNPACRNIYGYDQDEAAAFIGRPFTDTVWACHRRLLAEKLAACRESGGPVQYTVAIEKKDGRQGYIHCAMTQTKTPWGETLFISAFIEVTRLLTQQMALADADLLCQAAQTDSMTGLLNHDAVLKQIQDYLENEGAGGVHALFMIDLDNFKQINDNFGHQHGDQILIDMAAVIKGAFDAGDLVGRIGGDEFFALMKHAGKPEAIRQKALELLAALQYTCATPSGPRVLSSSIGISVYQGDHKPLSTLYAEADAALYQAKADGKNRFAYADGLGEAGQRHYVQAADASGIVHLHTLLGHINGVVAMAEVDDGIRITYASPSLFRLAAQHREALGGQGEKLLELIHEDDLPGLAAAIFKSARDGGQLDQICRLKGKSIPAERWHIRGSRLPGRFEGATRLGLIITDPGGDRSLTCADEDEIDPMTGLFHRQAFYRQVRRRIESRPEEKYLLVRFDLDRFKAFNDMQGTEAGDRLLTAIGQAMLKTNWESGIYGHIEADHFACFVPENAVDLEKKIAGINRLLQDYPANLRLTASIGVYTVDDPTLDVPLMCDRALLALRTVKKNYANKVAYYSEAMRQDLLEEQKLLGDMDGALQAEQFLIYFQPQVNHENGALIGAEALVRWDHPRRGLLLPDKFIPIFEKNGFISALDDYVLEKCCAYLRKWRDDQSLAVVSLAVNISRLDIYHPDFITKLRRLLEKYQLPSQCLRLEITESAYIENPAQLIRVVKNLQQLGFVVEMDDFGTGYSSLNTLKDVPVDVLKLDMRFLRESENNARGGNILNSVIRMARWLKLPIIAEGVETRQQADFLKNLGCLYMQGYYFAAPMPAQEFEALLSQGRREEINLFQNKDAGEMADFWDATTKTALLFNTMAGGASIMEYREGHLEIICSNDHLYKILGTTRTAYQELQTHVLDRFDEANRAVFLGMLETAIQTRQESECEVRSLPQPGNHHAYWTHNRAKLLAESGGSYILYVAVADITQKKHMEFRLNKLLELAVASRFEYICLLHTVSGQYELFANDGLNSHGLPRQGDFDTEIAGICQRLANAAAPSNDRGPFSLAAVLRDVRENDGHFSYQYALADGPREAAFYAYESTYRELLVTVRRLGRQDSPASGLEDGC